MFVVGGVRTPTGGLILTKICPDLVSMLVHYDTIGNVETGNVLPSVGLSWNDSLI